MYSFQNDYSEGAHPQILKALFDTNLSQQPGYGADEYTQKACRKIRRELNSPRAAIFLVTGGTQANRLVISSMLKSHEAVICVKGGHINEHEAGAVEDAGRKIIPVEDNDGKIESSAIEQVVAFHSMRPHMIRPRMVYISNSTEVGSIYSLSELKALSQVCKKHDLFLFMDGARLAQALTSPENDVSFHDIAALTDAFYIGGTKNGALFGEAVVFPDPAVCPDFDYAMKQHGALMAKGRSLGVQFHTLFKKNLYFDLGQQANRTAQIMAEGIKKAGYHFLTEPVSNQLFPIFPNKVIEKLRQEFAFYDWQKISDTKTTVRLVTSWATPESAVLDFIRVLNS